MYRIRFHGRGGQGMKTASRILGTAFFGSGFEVQDAPLYGAERRGAPIFAYVRAARRPIHERGVIDRPDLVVVADDTLVPIPTAGVMAGLGERSVLLVATGEEPAVWRDRLQLQGPILTLPIAAEERAELRFVGASCAAAAARLIGVISWADLERATQQELAPLGETVVVENLRRGRAAWDAFAPHEGLVVEGAEAASQVDERPDWIELPFEGARISAPDIHVAATSTEVRTGLWRTIRPVIDYDRCHRCTWVCSTLCPDSAIAVDAAGAPRIDLDHCKGCMICVAVCPTHAIETIPEGEAKHAESEEARP
jgi:pyruvate ferredoxin oxidoreductase gamma subunit